MIDPKEEAEWRRLMERLRGGKEPEPLLGGVTAIFDDAAARQMVGVLITKAILGGKQYDRLKLYCGDVTPRV